jgi:clan AA aspartic protease
MGIVRDEITITNALDIGDVKRGFMNAKDIRFVTVTAVVDSGTLRLTIPESLRQKLGLAVVKKVSATLADGEKLECGLSEAVEVRWKDRAEVTQAWIIQRECSVLLGAIPMEGMDLTIDMKNQKLVGAHGDEQIGILY